MLIAVVALVALVAACVTPESKEAHDAFVAAYEAANADGIITSEEAANLKALFQSYVELAGADVGNIDWSTVGLTALSTIIAALTGVRLLPNSMILGKKAAAGLPAET